MHGVQHPYVYILFTGQQGSAMHTNHMQLTATPTHTLTCPGQQAQPQRDAGTRISQESPTRSRLLTHSPHRHQSRQTSPPPQQYQLRSSLVSPALTYSQDFTDDDAPGQAGPHPTSLQQQQQRSRSADASVSRSLRVSEFQHGMQMDGRLGRQPASEDLGGSSSIAESVRLSLSRQSRGEGQRSGPGTGTRSG